MFLLFALAGCPPEEPVLPTVTIVAPADESTTASADVAVEVAVTDFDLVTPEETARFVPLPLWWAPSVAFAHDPSAEPEGYLHVTLDDGEPLDTIALEFTLEAVASGPHTLEVELLYPDGDPFYPAVRDAVDFTVP